MVWKQSLSEFKSCERTHFDHLLRSATLLHFMTMEYITSNKGRRKLAFENNIYIKQKVLSNGTVWGDIMGDFVQGDFFRGDFVQGILSGGFCPGGFVRGDFLLEPSLSYPGEGAKYAPLPFFLHHLKTAQGIKLKLSDFKDTPLRHI